MKRRAACAFAVCLAAGCSQEAAKPPQSVTLTGTYATAEVAGDTVQILNGKASVNGVSYGALAPGAQVVYQVNGKERRMWVSGELRKPVE